MQEGTPGSVDIKGEKEVRPRTGRVLRVRSTVRNLVCSRIHWSVEEEEGIEIKKMKWVTRSLQTYVQWWWK